MRALPFLCLLGCAPPTDRQRYTEALTGPLADAAGACAAISAAALRADCRSAAATRLAAAGQQPAAEALCAATQDPLWRDECWFGIADAAALHGDAAQQVCAQAGRYQTFCDRHALQRAVAAMDIATGAEAEAARRFGEEVTRRMPSFPHAIVRHTTNTLLAEQLSTRRDTQPFDLPLCGAMSTLLCRHAYWYTATQLHGKMRSVCDAGGARQAATVDAGLSGYTAAAAPIAEAVWDDLCGQIAAGRLAPEEISSAVPASLDGGMFPLDTP